MARNSISNQTWRIRLRLSASTDREVRKLVLDYNLEILPILMKFNSHEQAEWPLDAIDPQAIANWVDDRLVDFVKTYLSLHENEWYLKDHMVVDPIARTVPQIRGRFDARTGRQDLLFHRRRNAASLKRNMASLQAERIKEWAETNAKHSTSQRAIN